MRFVIATAALAGAAIATAAVAFTPHRAHAQTIDRYGGTSAASVPAQYGQTPAPAPSPYAQPAYAQAQYAPPANAASNAAPQTIATAGLRTLTWPGKTAEAPPRPPQAYAPPPRYAPPQAQAYPQARFAPPPSAQAYAATAPMAGYASNPGAVLPQSGGVQPRPTMPRLVPAEQAPPPATTAAYTPTPTRPAAPTSIYSDGRAASPSASASPYGAYGSAQAEAAAPGPSAQARPAEMTSGQSAALTPAQRAALLPPPSTASSARLYSLHREYGLTPDAAPIAPAFFTAAADLTAPETPDVAPRNTPTASKAAQNAARLAAAAGQ